MYIQIQDKEDLELLYPFAIEHGLDTRGPYYCNSSRTADHKFPIYIDIDDSTFTFKGWQDNIYNIGTRYLHEYNSGISVADLLGIPQGYEYW